MGANALVVHDVPPNSVVTGVVAKWLLLVVVLALGILVLALPPLPMLVAAVVVLLAQVFALALGG